MLKQNWGMTLGLNKTFRNKHNHAQIYSQNLGNRLRPDVAPHDGTSGLT